MKKERPKIEASQIGQSIKERLQGAVGCLVFEAWIHGKEEIGMRVKRTEGGWEVMVSGCGYWQQWLYGDRRNIEVESDPCAIGPNTKPDAPASPESDAGQNPEQGNEAQDLPGTHI